MIFSFSSLFFSTYFTPRLCVGTKTVWDIGQDLVRLAKTSSSLVWLNVNHPLLRTTTRPACVPCLWLIYSSRRR